MIKFSDGDKNESIIFNAGGKEIISLRSNGDIYVKGNLIKNDKEVVDGMREFLKLSR
ncbi:hypothetical protein ACIQHV_11100 [Bacillus bombysepticus]|uniref:hypothetical protein n=1 Tax=Bacillus thuringiensis TaxID=1428 RepID=UPI0015948A9E|nr:hypothetical protein [Bacillus thuringiensis]MEC2869941.1 hypothetical protein [Bacillus cereus]